MIKFFKRVFAFIRQNPSVLYSLFLLVFLPLILWWNTAFTIKSFEKNIDLTLQRKALTVENVLAEIIPDKISSGGALQEKLDKISQENPEIEELKVIVFEDNKFKIAASQDKEELQRETTDPSLTLAWHQEQNIAHLISKKEERFWHVIKPIYKEDGEKIALLSMALSLQDTDRTIARTIQLAYLIVILAILVSLFLVLHHTRLFQYLQLYQELRKVSKMKDEFVRMAIHELQSPIVNIRGYIESLKEKTEQSLGPEEKEDLSRISVSAQSLSELIYDILEVARIERGTLDVSSQRVSPQTIVQELIDALKPKAENRGLQLFYQKEELNLTIDVNPLRFKEILQNLIENAIKYTEQGKIEIKEGIDPKKEVYYLCVEDSGVGISGEEQAMLFENFYRVKNRETAGIAGTGLGLWIVKTLCQQMKGNVVVESIKGVGTKFTVSFPAVLLKA